MIRYLKSQKPIEVNLPPSEMAVLENGDVELFSERITIPPLNTDIRHTLLLSQCPKIKYTEVPHINFSWAIHDDNDLDDVKFKKNLIHKVPNQQGCGSCWAVSTASAVSDCLVVGGVTREYPNISPTFCLACFPQHQCNGGMPAKLALDIMNHGVPDNTCVDYSWCTNVRGCDTSRGPISHTLNSRIPPCACSKHYNKKLYFLDKGSVVTISITPSRPVTTFRSNVKSHIYNYGPVVGGFLVLENFLSGNFTKSNGGVYFDRADYSISDGDKITFDDSINHFRNSKGLHAIVVVGWGIAKNIQYDNGKVGDVPYWHCRNSWGTIWGDNGFFKIAMYPFNKIAQLDKMVNVRVGGEPSKIGGLILFTATKTKDLETNDIKPQRYTTTYSNTMDIYHPIYLTIALLTILIIIVWLSTMIFV